MRIAASALLSLTLSLISLRAASADFGSKDEAVAMVQRVEETFKKDGADATFKIASDPSSKEFHDRDLYPFIYNMAAVCVAHGPGRR